MSDPAPPPSSAAPWSRLAVTLLLVPAIVLAPAITLPGVDGAELERLSRDAGGGAGNFGIFALGVMPFVSAAILVEIAALSVPRWRPLRHGGPEGRATLGRATRVLALLLCAFQGYGITLLIQSLGQNAALGAVSVPMAVLTMTAGTFLLGFACELAGARGLAGGLGVALGWIPIAEVIRRFGRQALAGALAPLDVVTFAAMAAPVVAATWFVLRPRPASPPAPAAPEPTYRSSPAEDAPPPPIVIPAPASGLAPLVVSASLLAYPATLATLNLPVPFADKLHDDTTYFGVWLVLIALLCAAFAWLFNAPARVAALGARAVKGRSVEELEVEARGQMRGAVIRALGFLVVLFAIDRLGARLTGHSLAAPASVVALATAIALDVVAEWRARRARPDLVPVWPEHRPYALAAAREALDAAGITVHARGESQRRLLQFGGPYVPIDLMVPSADAERATKILKRVLLPKKGDAAAEESRPRVTARPRPMATAEKLTLAATALIALVVLAAPKPAPHQAAPRPPLRADAMQLLAVDEGPDPFGDAALSLPRGVSIALENTPDGPGNSVVRHYARIMQDAGESLEQARARLLAWAEPLAPPGDRVLSAAMFEHDDDKDTDEQIGHRTYLVKRSVVIDGADIAGAAAEPEAQDHGAGPARWHVRVDLRPAGAERFRAFTAANIKRRLAIVVDGKVSSAPVIQSEIPGGVVTISLGSSVPEQQRVDAKRLADSLTGR